MMLFKFHSYQMASIKLDVTLATAVLLRHKISSLQDTFVSSALYEHTGQHIVPSSQSMCHDFDCGISVFTYEKINIQNLQNKQESCAIAKMTT